MPFRDTVATAVPLAILLLLGGVAWSYAQPESMGARITLIAGAVLAAPMVLAVVLDGVLGLTGRVSAQRAMTRLVALTGSEDPGAEQDADALLERLRKGPRPVLDLSDFPGFVEAATTPGPQQIACLRYVMSCFWAGREPYTSVIKELADRIRDAGLDEAERVELQRWVTSPVAGASSDSSPPDPPSAYDATS